MPIDWFTVIAQILNFLVLVWILKRFLYKPVLDAIAQRQERVQRSLTEAAAAKADAETERSRLEAERKELETHRESAMAGARTEAQAEKKRLVDEARAEFDADRERWRNALEREQADFQRELSNLAHTEVIGIADKLLRDLADTDLQERIMEKFLRMLSGLGAEEKATLQAAMSETGNRAVTIRSAFELSPERRQAVSAVVEDILASGVPVEFETKGTLGCGIELSVDGHKIAWTLEDYLRSLDTWVQELIVHQKKQHTA